MSLVSTLSYYTKHPKVTTFFGVIAATVGVVQDVLIEYANFGHYIAGLSLFLLVLIESFHLAGKDSILKIKFGDDWPGLGIAATTILAVLMGGAYFWSQNYKSEGGVLATNFESVEDFQNTIHTIVKAIDERTQRIEEGQKVIAETTKSIKEDTAITRDNTADIKHQIETDPETIVKKYGLTLNETGYFNLISRHSDPIVFTKLLPLYRDYGFDLNMSVNATPLGSRLWSQLTNASLQPFFFMDWSVIEASIFLGETNLPGLSYALRWEAKNGRDLNEYKIKNIGDTQVVSNHSLSSCGQYMVPSNSCFRAHNVRFRLGADVRNIGLTLAHIAVLSGNLASLEWVADQGVNLRTREGSNYTPLSIAIELNNKAIESWLLKNAEAIPDDSSVEYEVAAFKAFDQFDSAVNSIKYLPYPGDKSYAGVYQKHEVWLGKFPEQINSTQSTLTFLKPGKHKTEIKSRLYTQVNPLLQYCESIIRQSQKEDRQSQDAQNQINRYEIHGISSIEQVDRQVDHYGSTINKVKKYIQETQSKLSTTRDQYAKLQQEMAKKKRLHDQTQKRRYSFNQFTQTEEWKAAFNQESKISKSMILLKSSISKVKYELESSDKSVKEMNAEIEKIQSKIGELQATREKISNEEPDSSSVMTRLGQNLENACAVAKNFINSI